jgi:hypothetical protein
MCTSVTDHHSLIGVLGCCASVLSGAASANMSGDGDVAEAADADRGEHLDVDAAPVTLVVPAVRKRLNQGFPAGQAFGAADDGRIAHQNEGPDLLHVVA